MKKFLSIIVLTVVLIFQTNIKANAFPFFNKVSKIIRTSNIEDVSAISVTAKEIKNSNYIYSKKSKKLLAPASSIKIFTFASILNTLGEDYEFETAIYTDTSNNLYIKLGADPLLTSGDLAYLIKETKKNFDFSKLNKIYIDDMIIDKCPYPNGWLIDDEWPNMPKLSPYTLDKNTVTITIVPPTDNTGFQIIQNNEYKMAIINELENGVDNKVTAEKQYGDETDIINLKGKINKPIELNIAVDNPKFYFVANLIKILEKEKITYKKQVMFAPVSKNLKKIASTSHNMEKIGQAIFYNSDNFVSETAFKIAGGKFKGKITGTTTDGIEMFYDYYSKIEFDSIDVKLTDASGVSRYDLVTTDWMCDALVYLSKNTNIKNYMATPNIGTLKRRLQHLDGKLWAKTGTLNGVSSLTGYMTNKKGENVAFSIIIQNHNKRTSVIKSLEDDLVDAIYKLR